MVLRVIACSAILSLALFAQERTKVNSNESRATAPQTCGESISGVPRTIPEHFGNYWLDQDAKYLITDPERRAYATLQTDGERDRFIHAFWLRRDPTPDTIENELQDEHYRRIVYANEKFSARVPGWETDRGRIYVMYGPPDSIDPANTTRGATVPTEMWRYRYVDGIGQEVTFEFADNCKCGDFRFKHISSHDLPTISFEDLVRQEPSDPRPISPAVFLQAREPSVTFKELQDAVAGERGVAVSPFRYSDPPFVFKMSAVRATEFSDWVSLTLQVQNRDLLWKQEDGKASAHLRIVAVITGITGRREATIEYEAHKSEDATPASSLKDGEWQTTRWFALPVGRYRVDVVVQDANSGKIATKSHGVFAPGFYRDNLEISSLLLADKVDIPQLRLAYPISGELFVGDIRIHQRMLEIFHSDEQLYALTQAYNLAVDPNTGKSDAAITYSMTNISTGKVAVESHDASSNMRGSGEQMTFWPAIPLKNIPPGDYRVCVAVNDRIGNRTSASSTSVRIE